MPETPFAVVFTYVPEEDRAYTTTFSGDTCDDPLTMAHNFRRSEEERGDFPGSLWCVTGNEAATEIRKDSFLAALGMGGTPDGD